MLKSAPAPTTPNRQPVEPLFALNSRSWLLCWTAALEVSLGVATALAVYRVGSWDVFWHAPQTPLIMLIAFLLALLGWMGFALRHVVFSRTAYPVLLVALSWTMMAWLSVLDDTYLFLSTTAVLQTFIFLPFRWASAATVVLLSLITIASLSFQESTMQALREMLERGTYPAWMVWSSVLSNAAVGLIMMAIIHYIHRANREAAIRQDLIERLEIAQRDLADREREAGVLQERARLARDLHDTLAQGLTSVVTHLSAAELALDGNRETARRHLARARESARANLAEIRRLVWALRPAALEDAPLEGALARLVDQWSAQTGVNAELCLQGHAQPLHAHAEVALLRLAQEALSNVARHAHARMVRVALTFEREFVMLSIDDDGVGFDAEQPGGGLGLTGMRERAAALGGRVLIDSNDGEGTSVTVALPLASVVAQGEVHA